MLKGNRIFILLFIITILVVMVGSYFSSKVEDRWKPTYASTEKTPFGTSLVYQLLPSIFTKGKIEKVNRPIYNFLKNKELVQTNYIFIGDDFILEDLDRKTLLSYVAKGNNVFIAANSYSENLEDTLQFYTTFSIENFADIVHPENSKDNYINTFTNKKISTPQQYTFKSMFDAYQIVPIDTMGFEVLAVDNYQHPVFVRTKYGEGYIYIHAFPLAFTNYNLLYQQNAGYMAKCFSYLPNRPTFWDDYYKVHHHQEASKLDLIYKEKSLKWAWYIAIVATIIFVLFRMKRQQRIIPLHPPLTNTSLEFATTIGRLYYNKADHKDLVKKQVLFWLEYIRTKMNIPTTKLDASFVHLVAEKSGVDASLIKEIVDFVSELNYGLVSNADVINLYNLIQKFYKQSKR
jgi:hypothetical protein